MTNVAEATACTPYICAVPPTSHELALQYLLELSSDIRSALLWDEDGVLQAAAPGGRELAGRLADLGAELARRAEAAFPEAGDATLELDIGCDGGAVFLIRDRGTTLVCVTERSVLPGLIFYDMHAVLTDLERAAAAEGRRREAAAG
jgi:predicted regulator of Ras-like GTPase activity (Roadblock/LC7/MglB family)